MMDLLMSTEPLSKNINLRMSEKQYEQYHAQARKEQVPVTVWMRKHLDRAITRESSDR